MIETAFRPAVLAALAFASFASFTAPASAQDAVVPADARFVYAQPDVVDEAAPVPPRVMGNFTCAFNESHTRLERKNCGGTHYPYGR